MKSYYCPARGRIKEVSPIETYEQQVQHSVACHILLVVIERAVKRPIPEGVKAWEAEDERLGVDASACFREAIAAGRIWEGPQF